MSHDTLTNARSMLGELGSMSEQTDAMSQRILRDAQEQLEHVESQIKDSRVAALTGTDAEKQSYQDLIEERGRLAHVIASVKAEAYGQT